MKSTADIFAARIRRTLSENGKQLPSGREMPGSSYRVVSLSDPLLDQRLGRCLLLSRIGQGAMSVVYLGKQDITGRLVAVKIMRSHLLSEPGNIKRFQREARALSRLSHPNLLTVFDVGETPDGRPYFVMDYLDGQSLGQVLEAEGALSAERVVRIFSQVCQAMEHSHRQGIIHRDLKPDNIMLLNNSEQRDFVKVVDFGVVKATDESQLFSQRLTQTGEIWGSPVYMSPEQCMGNKLDARSDIYSLGAVMYECLTGKELFQGKQIADIIVKQLNQAPAPFSAVRGDNSVPAWLEDIVFKALEKDPGKRFQSMQEFRAALGQSLCAATPAVEPGSTAGQEDSDPFLKHTLCDRYFVLEAIGQGGMSVVYKARQTMVDRIVAIKMLRKELCSDEACVKRFQREARAISRLSHPHLITVHDVGMAPTGQPYFVMEYIEGLSLADLLKQGGPLSPERTLPVFVQVCDAIGYAHAAGVIHRDLKPDNIMLIENGSSCDYVKVVDLGIIKVMDDSPLAADLVSQKLTRTGQTWGSPIYMSPEQCMGQTLDPRSDIYSLGAVLYEVLSGHPVFEDKKITEVINRQVSEMPRTFAQVSLDRQIPQSLEQLIFKCLQKDPRKRYQSMEELAIALAAALPGAGSRPARQAAAKQAKEKEQPPPPASLAPPGASSARIPLLPVAVAALLVGAAIAWWIMRPAQKNGQPAQPATGNNAHIERKVEGQRQTNSGNLQILPPGEPREKKEKTVAPGPAAPAGTVAGNPGRQGKTTSAGSGKQHHRPARTTGLPVAGQSADVMDPGNSPRHKHPANDTYGYYDLKTGN